MQIARIDVPTNIINSFISKHGEEEAMIWVDNVAKLIDILSTEWGFTPTGTLSGGTKSVCITGHHSNRKAVLKISPVEEMGIHEIEALAAWQGHKVPQIIAVHGDNSTFLMEYLEPVEEFASLHHIFDLASGLHSRNHTNFRFPDLRQNVAMRFGWAAKRVEAQAGTDYANDIAQARAIADRLLDTTTNISLLHGDFQMKNIINTPSGPHAIDPMPCVGDSLFDLALWLVCSSLDTNLAASLLECENRMHADDYQRFLLWLWCVEVLEQTTAKTQSSQEKLKLIKQAMTASIQLDA